jgi:hypothetical protein
MDGFPAQNPPLGMMPHETGFDSRRYFAPARLAMQSDHDPTAVGFRKPNIVRIAIYAPNDNFSTSSIAPKNHRFREGAVQLSCRSVCRIEWHDDIPPGRDRGRHERKIRGFLP